MIFISARVPALREPLHLVIKSQFLLSPWLFLSLLPGATISIYILIVSCCLIQFLCPFPVCVQNAHSHLTPVCSGHYAAAPLQRSHQQLQLDGFQTFNVIRTLVSALITCCCCLTFTVKGFYRCIQSMTKSYWAEATEDESTAECFFFRLPGTGPVGAAHGHPNSSWHTTLRLRQLHCFLWWIYRPSLNFLCASLAPFSLKLSTFL